MPLIIADRVKETTTATGTGTVTLLGASTGFQSFAVIGNANTTYYTIAGQTGSEWEVGIGTYTASGTTLARTTVLSSSNAGSLVNFSAGTKDVFVTYPAGKSVNLNESNNSSALGTPTTFIGTNITGTATSFTASNVTTNANLTGAVTSVGNAASLGSFTSAQLATALTDETGTGANVFATSPTLVTPALGTPSSGIVTNLTGTASININGTVGATTAAAGAFTTLSASGTSTLAAVNSGALAVTGAISSTTDATLSGVRVGKGAGAISSNTALGSGALNANTTGTNNTASGYQALYYNTTGYANNANGALTLYYNTTGYTNTANGVAALRNNTTGNSNTASGQNALTNNTTGNSNTADGYQALYNNTTGINNTAIGQSALFYNTTGYSNTANGISALSNNTTGNSNTASGQNALTNNTTGSGNTAISPLNSAGSYVPVFDPTTENNRFCMGSTGVTNAYIQVAWTVVSDARDKTNFAPVPHGLEFVKALQPTAYQFRTARDSEETNGGVRYGFKAQDVLALEGANPVIVDNEDADKLRMIDTALIPVLVKAIQEQQALIESLTTRLTALESKP